MPRQACQLHKRVVSFPACIVSFSLFCYCCLLHSCSALPAPSLDAADLHTQHLKLSLGGRKSYRREGGARRFKLQSVKSCAVVWGD